MKAVSEWFWMATGIICGMIIFTIAYLQIVGINKLTTEQRSLEQFGEIKNIVNNLCWSNPSNKREYTASLNENIEGIYVASSKYKKYDEKELMDMILSTEDSIGNYLCIKIKDKRLECKELECDTTMPFIGSVPEEFSLSALVNKLTGRGKIFDYYLEFERMRDNVEVKIRYGCETPSPTFSQIITCSNKNVVVQLGNLLVIGDSTFFVECCDELSKNFETLLVNSAKEFGGSKILIIWEDEKADPDTEKKGALMDKIEKSGFTIESLKHDDEISSEKLKNYNQVWLIRPGICENPIMNQYCDYEWKKYEFDVLKHYLSKGKVVLITDYPSIVPPRVGDKIIKLVDQNVTILNECVCGCDGKTIKADKIFDYKITKDIEQFFVKASAAFDMECILNNK